MELAAKMAQDASKSDFYEALEASWERLGKPKREPSWSKIEAGRVFFLKVKKQEYSKLFECIFDRFGSPLGKQK